MSECLCKVKKGLECCSTGACKTECPYFGSGDCGANLTTDALQIITEQETMLEEKQKHLENLQKVNEDLEERIAIMSEGGWHDAEKDQPKETDCYIVRIDYGVGQMTTMREYVSSEGKWLKSIEEKITHWMPLPKPPKG